MNIFSDAYVVRYDEESRAIAIALIDSNAPLFEISLATLEELGLAEASKFLGERLLLLLPEPRRVLTGLPATVDTDQISSAIERMREKAKYSDSESEYRLAMLLISRATTNGAWSDIEEAESLLQLAQNKGHDEATKFLTKTWPDIKAGYLKPD
jgi:hypothetical protein